MPEIWAKGTGETTRATRAGLGGVDLHLDLSGTKLRAGLESALRAAVRAGRLRPGTRLPSSRALAADLGIARNTVAEVYRQLLAIDGLEHYRAAADDGRAGLVIGYGRPPEHAYATAVARLCAALPGQDRTGMTAAHE